MTHIGNLIVFEGPDGARRSRLAVALTDHIISTGKACEYMVFPVVPNGNNEALDTSFPQLSTENCSISKTSYEMLIIAQHIDLIERSIIPLLREGKSIVLDCFWWSTWVHGRQAGISRDLLSSMLKIELIAWQDILPMAVFQFFKTNHTAGTDDEIEISSVYGDLIQDEQKKYPISIVDGNLSFTDSLGLILQQIQMASSSGNTDSALNPKTSPPSLPAEPIQLSFFSPHSYNRNPPYGKTPYVFSHLSPAKPTEVYNTYWRFAVERQAIFFRRINAAPPPWSKDPILVNHKFTNAYRASDRVSQYLIRNVIYEGDSSPEEMFFRIILFKVFNRISTWQLFEDSLGTVRYSDYEFKLYDQILNRAKQSGIAIYSAAYIMPSGGKGAIYPEKHRHHLKLIEQMMKDGVPSRICEMSSMQQAFELIRSYPTIGDFLAYQYITDINYSPLTNFSEMEFVVPGPGARDGIKKSFRDYGGLSEVDIIRLVADRQEAEFDRLSLSFQSLWGRRLQLIDCQNLFCEVDKYSRLAHPEIIGRSGRTRIKQMYKRTPGIINYWYPPKWGLNERIDQSKQGKGYEDPPASS